MAAEYSASAHEGLDFERGIRSSGDPDGPAQSEVLQSHDPVHGKRQQNIQE